ncbi:MAG: hypothetical protein IT380_30180 [Myxococcales bacterium]|nr:hypothetical protein [Myxococcales bacterium]
MEDFIFTPIVLAVGIGIHALVLRRHPPSEAPLITLSFAGHVVSGIVQVLLVKYYFKGGGDMLAYYEFGVPLAELLRADFPKFAPELVKAFFQSDEFFLPANLAGGGSTQSMSAATAFLLFLVGNSLYAASVLLGIVTYVSQLMIAWALREYFPRDRQRLVLIGATLLPSAVFWSSAVLKEPLIMAALGPLMLGLKWLSLGKHRALAVLLVIPGATLMAMLKPYVLMTLSISAAIFYLWTRFRVSEDALKPFAVIMALAIGAGGLVLGSRYFGKAESSNAASSLASQRRVGYQIEGGSNYQLDAPAPVEDVEQRSLSQELALAPVALLTAFFRPFIFEARNAVQFVNALEATVLLVLFVQVLRRRTWSGLIGAIRGSPAMLFCFTFAFALALGTGLASSNIGTLSRYRAPMMPFFFTLLLVLREVPQPAPVTGQTTLTPAGAGR